MFFKDMAYERADMMQIWNRITFMSEIIRGSHTMVSGVEKTSTRRTRKTTQFSSSHSLSVTHTDDLKWNIKMESIVKEKEKTQTNRTEHTKAEACMHYLFHFIEIYRPAKIEKSDLPKWTKYIRKWGQRWFTSQSTDKKGKKKWRKKKEHTRPLPLFVLNTSSRVHTMYAAYTCAHNVETWNTKQAATIFRAARMGVEARETKW